LVSLALAIAFLQRDTILRQIVDKRLSETLGGRMLLNEDAGGILQTGGESLS
jgi:hypothetical protein